MTWESLSTDVAEVFAKLGGCLEMRSVDFDDCNRLSWAGTAGWQPCRFVRPDPSSIRETLSYEERLQRRRNWRQKTGYLAKVHAELRAKEGAWEAKKAYQNKYRRESGKTAEYWAALKADPERHALELQKRRERRKARRNAA